MLDLSRQFATIREDLLQAIESVCTSQQYILGPQVGSFERAVAEVCQVQHAVGCASGTDALWLAMAAAGVGSGDAVVTSPFSFFATVSAILRAGAHPVLADIEPDTYNLSPVATESLLRQPRSLTPPVRAILPVHLYGQCADFDAFDSLKAEFGLILIEDAAQAFGATWQGRPAGSLGDAAAFSFYPTKNLSAMGDAGLVSTPSSTLEERARMLRAHGMRRRYFHDEVGWNSRLDTIQAAILEIKLRHLPEWNRSRRRVAARYDQLFRDAGLVATSLADFRLAGGIVLPYTDPRATHVFHQYVIRAPRRDELRRHLADQRIASEIYYPLPLHLQIAFKDLGYKPGDFPVSEAAAAEVLALPIYPELRHDEQDRVVDAVCRFYA